MLCMRKNIQSILVEGGPTTLNTFIDADLWDEARVLTGINHISSGKKAPSLNCSPKKSFYFGKDLVTIY